VRAWFDRRPARRHADSPTLIFEPCLCPSVRVRDGLSAHRSVERGSDAASHLDAKMVMSGDSPTSAPRATTPQLSQRRLGLRRIVLRAVNHLPRHPRRLRDYRGARSLREHVRYDIELLPPERRLAASIGVRLGGLGVGDTGPLGLAGGSARASAVAAKVTRARAENVQFLAA
jgi:hypothetical protein